MKVTIDASVLVGLINPRDLWRSQALDIHRTLLDARADLTRCPG